MGLPIRAVPETLVGSAIPAVHVIHVVPETHGALRIPAAPPTRVVEDGQLHGRITSWRIGMATHIERRSTAGNSAAAQVGARPPIDQGGLAVRAQAVHALRGPSVT